MSTSSRPAGPHDGTKLFISPDAGVIPISEETVIARGDGASIVARGIDGKIANQVLVQLMDPATLETVSSNVAQIVNVTKTESKRVIRRLMAAGVIRESGSKQIERSWEGFKLVIGVTGAVAAAVVPSLLLALTRLGFCCRVVATSSACRLVSSEAMRAITGHEVFKGFWTRSEGVNVPHIEIARWADAMIVYPASATTLCRIATGSCDDLVAAVALATSAPVVLAPSMNSSLLRSRAIQRNIVRLRRDGFVMINPTYGRELADDTPDLEYGAAPPPPVIAEMLLHFLSHELDEHVRTNKQ